MIGAHVPQKTKTKRPRLGLYESGRMFRRAFDAWTERPEQPRVSVAGSK